MRRSNRKLIGSVHFQIGLMMLALLSVPAISQVVQGEEITTIDSR